MDSVSEGTIDTRIKRLLRDHPRGLTTTAIAKSVGMNRNSTAKHLEVLQAMGNVESTTYGSAKVYFLSRRIPASALLDLASDLVCVIDEKDRLTVVNENFISFFGLQRKKAIGEVFDRLFLGADVETLLQEMVHGDVSDRLSKPREIQVTRNDREYQLRIKAIPTVFEDQSRGTTIVMEDVTREREYVRNLEFLAETSAYLADMGDEENIYRYIAEKVAILSPGSAVGVSSSSESTGIVKLEALAGDTDLVVKMMTGLGLTLDNLTLDMKKWPEGAELLCTGRLIEGPGGEGPEGLYVQMFRCCPMELCEEVCRRFPVGKYYAMGCSCRGGLFGNVLIRLRKGVELRNKKTIEAFIRQAGVALQRRHLREKLRKAEVRPEATKTGIP